MSSIISNYFFRVRITEGAEHALVENTNMLNNFYEVALTSAQFTDYIECTNVLSAVMTKFMNALNTPETPFVLMTRINPDLDLTGATEKLAGEEWESDTLARLYLADADRLKNESLLVYSVSADVKADKDSINAVTRLAGTRPQ